MRECVVCAEDQLTDLKAPGDKGEGKDRLEGKLGPAKGVFVGCAIAAVLWILIGLAVWLAVR